MSCNVTEDDRGYCRVLIAAIQVAMSHFGEERTKEVLSNMLNSDIVFGRKDKVRECKEYGDSDLASMIEALK